MWKCIKEGEEFCSSLETQSALLVGIEFLVIQSVSTNMMMIFCYVCVSVLGIIN